MIRAIAGVTGALLIASAAHVNIVASGGYDQMTAPIMIALAIGVAVGAAAIGAAAGYGRTLLAFAIGASLIAGEAYALLSTSERVIASREAAQAPLRDAARTHAAAVAQLSDARGRLTAVKADTSEPARVTDARRAVDTANAAVREQASLPGCRVNCRELLQAQADAARRELYQALGQSRSATDTAVEDAEKAVADADRAVAANPAPRSATPLADRLGVEPWLIDVIAAGLLSLAVNGLGAALIALAAHHKTRPAKVEIVTPRPAIARTGSVTRFLLDEVEPADGQIEVGDLYQAYHRWCGEQKVAPGDVEMFGNALSAALKAAGVGRRSAGGRLYLTGVTLGNRAQ